MRLHFWCDPFPVVFNADHEFFPVQFFCYVDPAAHISLAGFHRMDGWKVGVDGSVALITVGAGGSIDTDKITSPIVGFILDNKGLMYNLTLEGSKISRISR